MAARAPRRADAARDARHARDGHRLVSGNDRRRDRSAGHAHSVVAGLSQKIDPMLARSLFWWFGHPLVYFWLLPAYVLWYTVLPSVAGGRLFSDRLARIVFVMFMLLSTPVGFHHQFMDPGISAGWKFAHTLTTYAILYPSFVTAFTVIASLEVADG